MKYSNHQTKYIRK